MYQDHSEVELARAALLKPNKFICLKCHAQALLESEIVHKEFCPTRVTCRRCRPKKGIL